MLHGQYTTPVGIAQLFFSFDAFARFAPYLNSILLTCISCFFCNWIVLALIAARPLERDWQWLSTCASVPLRWLCRRRFAAGDLSWHSVLRLRRYGNLTASGASPRICWKRPRRLTANRVEGGACGARSLPGLAALGPDIHLDVCGCGKRRGRSCPQARGTIRFKSGMKWPIFRNEL